MSSAIEQLALVVRLACQIEDRSRSEQAALVAVARRVDAERNRFSESNPRLADFVREVRSARPAERVNWPECSFTPDHKSGCRCRQLPDHIVGKLPTPEVGWSRLEAEVLDTLVYVDGREVA